MRDPFGRLLTVLCVTLLPVAVAVLAADRLAPSTLVLGGLLAVTAVVVATRRPIPAMVVGIVATALVPIYYARPIGGSGTLATLPAVIVAVLLLPLALYRAAGLRVQALDIAVTSYLVCQSCAYILDTHAALGAVGGLLLKVGLPYVVWRVLSRDVRAPRAMAIGLVSLGGVLALQALTERAEGNPFFTLITPVYEAAVWAHPQVRLGQVRVESSFGHPIAFGLFLALVITLSVSLLLTPTSLPARGALLVTIGLSVVALVETQSRGPIIVALASVVVVLGRLRLRRSPLLVVGALVVVAGLLTVGPQAGEINNLVQASQQGTDTAIGNSTQYRQRLFDVLTDPADFSLLGKPYTGNSIDAGVSQTSSLGSIDDEFVYIFLAGGLLSMLAFIAVALLLIRGVFVLRRAGPLVFGLTVVMGATTISLLSVALLTQQASLFWIMTGVIASAEERLALGRGRNAARPLPRAVPSDPARALARV